MFTSWVASIEAFIGLMSFALATARYTVGFPSPGLNMKFSRNMIVAPVGELTGLQFMLANQSASNIMDLEATVNFSWVDGVGGDSIRRFKQPILNCQR
jgi:inward rectifier potassium channel